jgi:uncharacterized protein YdaU (DUF1376 family)
MSEGLPWFKIWAAETLSDERFSGWTMEERGAWFTLIVHAWREGSIPSDQQSLGRLCHCDSQAMRALWSAIGDRFVEAPGKPGRLVSPRLERERDEGKERLQRAKEAGSSGASKRWGKGKRGNSDPIATLSQPDSDPNATPMRFDSASASASAQQQQKQLPAPAAPVTRLPRVGAHKAPNPRHAPMVARLSAAFESVRGATYGFQPIDARKVADLLALGPDDEIVARWKRALAHQGYPAVSSLTDLVKNWNAFGGSGPVRQVANGARRVDDWEPAPGPPPDIAVPLFPEDS